MKICRDTFIRAMKTMILANPKAFDGKMTAQQLQAIEVAAKSAKNVRSERDANLIWPGVAQELYTEVTREPVIIRARPKPRLVKS